MNFAFADREKAAKIVMRLALGQAHLDGTKLRHDAIGLMRKEGTEPAGKDHLFEQNEPPNLHGAAEADQKSSLPFCGKPGSGLAVGRARQGKETLQGLGVVVASLGFAAVCFLTSTRLSTTGRSPDGHPRTIVAWCAIILLLVGGLQGWQLLRRKQ